MPFWTVILKNNSGSTVVVEELGIEILNGTQITASDFFDYSDLADCKDLDSLVGSGDLVVNNGVSDLSASDGVQYLKRDNVYNDLQTHYTKTELNTAGGGGQVDWANIINAPSFGSPTWIDPVSYMVLDITATAPSAAVVGDVYIDTDDQNYYKFNGATWDSIGSASVNDRVVDLSVNPQTVAVFDGVDTWTASSEEIDNTAVMVNDDGDLKNAQYIYQEEDGTWTKIADVDFDDHLDGASSKHDASEIDVEGTYTNITTSPGDLETVIEDIDTLLTEALDNNTLDGAYDEGGAGAGRVIHADVGAVEIDTDAATTAPLRLVPKAALPTTGLLDGQLAISDGLLFIYDATRGKWLSVQRQFLVFGRAGNTKNQYINFAAGNLASNNSGYRLPRNSTIVSLSGQIDATGNCSMYVRKNDVATNISTLTITTATGSKDVSVNVDVDADSFLQSYLASTDASGVQDPMFIVEIAYRL